MGCGTWNYCSACVEPECDRCPNEDYCRTPGWWLNLKAGNNQAAAEPPKIEIICPWGESGWVSGTIGDFHFCAKVYGAPSNYGINGGCVSKLGIKKGKRPVVNYQRGWDIQPGSDEVREIFRAVLEYLEAMPAAEKRDEE